MTAKLAGVLARHCHWLFGAMVTFALAYALALMPVAFGDQFDEIVWTFHFSLFEIYEKYLTEPSIYFRPLEFFWRDLLLVLFGQDLFSYNIWGICMLAIITFLFLWHCRVATAREGLAAVIALSAMLGHHAFGASLELNQVVTNLVLVNVILLSFFVLESKGGPAATACALLLSFIAILNKETGVVVPALFVLGWLGGFPGAGLRTAAAVTILTAAFIAYRLYVVLWLGEIADSSYAPGGDPMLYLRNVAATLLNTLISEPKNGAFGAFWTGLSQGLAGRWKLAQIAAPLLACVTIGYAVVRSRIWRPEADPILRRWLILTLGALLATCALGFFHTADYFAITSLPPLAALLFLALRRVMGEIEDPSLAIARRMGLVILLIALSATSTFRIPTNLMFVRSLSAAIQEDWVRMDPDLLDRYQSERARLDLQIFRDHALGTPLPSEGRIDRRLRRNFGDKASISR